MINLYMLTNHLYFFLVINDKHFTWFACFRDFICEYFGNVIQHNLMKYVDRLD